MCSLMAFTYNSNFGRCQNRIKNAIYILFDMFDLEYFSLFELLII